MEHIVVSYWTSFTLIHNYISLLTRCFTGWKLLPHQVFSIHQYSSVYDTDASSIWPCGGSCQIFMLGSFSAISSSLMFSHQYLYESMRAWCHFHAINLCRRFPVTETNGLTRNIDLRLELQSYSRLLLTTSRLGGHNMDCIFILVSISFSSHCKWDLSFGLCTATTTLISGL